MAHGREEVGLGSGQGFGPVAGLAQIDFGPLTHREGLGQVLARMFQVGGDCRRMQGPSPEDRGAHAAHAGVGEDDRDIQHIVDCLSAGLTGRRQFMVLGPGDEAEQDAEIEGSRPQAAPILIGDQSGRGQKEEQVRFVPTAALVDEGDDQDLEGEAGGEAGGSCPWPVMAEGGEGGDHPWAGERRDQPGSAVGREGDAEAGEDHQEPENQAVGLGPGRPQDVFAAGRDGAHHGRNRPCRRHANP